MSSNLLSVLEQQGYAVSKNYLTSKECDELLADISQLVEETPASGLMTASHHWEKPGGGNAEDETALKDEYFLKSGDGVGFFMRGDSDVDLEKCSLSDKVEAVGRIGYGIHIHRPAFRKFTFTGKARNLAKSMGYKKPVVVQSQYISDAVAKHQDLTYLYAEPATSIIGVWIALSDSCRENCKLFVIPGSNKKGLIDNNRFVRIIDPKSPNKIGLGYTHSADVLSGIDESKFVGVPLKKGDAAFLTSQLIYKTEKCNKAGANRHNLSYYFNIGESDRVEWDGRNFLQPKYGPFMSLNDTKRK